MSSSKSKKNQLVVIQQQKPKPKQQQKPKNRPIKGYSFGNDHLNAYASALMRPFSKAAMGAQVPDMYSYPTATYHTEGTITIISNNLGVASFIMTPDPYCSFIDMTTASVNTSSMARYFGTSPDAYASVIQSSLAGVLTNYRVVGGGIQIRNLLPPTTATGRVIIATVPMADNMPGPNSLLCATSNYTLAAHAIGVRPAGGSDIASTTAGLNSNIIQLPGAVELTVQDLISQSLSVNFRPVSPGAFDFKNVTNDQYLTSIAGVPYSDQAIVSNATGLGNPAVSDSLASKQPTGFDAICVRLEGLPPLAICADVRYVLHFEGTPALTNAVGSIVPAVQNSPVVNVIGHQRVLDSALSTSNIMFGVEAIAAGVAGYASNGLTGAASNILAKLGMSF